MEVGLRYRRLWRISLRHASFQSRPKCWNSLMKRVFLSTSTRKVTNPRDRQAIAVTTKPASNDPHTVYVFQDAVRSQRMYLWLGLATLGGVGLMAFMPELKLGVSKHTAEVATRSLQDEQLQQHTRELASQIVQTVLNDPQVMQQASSFLNRLGSTPGMQAAAQSLVIYILQNVHFQDQIATLAKSIAASILEDPQIYQSLLSVLRKLIQDNQNKEALLALVSQILTDENFQRTISEQTIQLLTQETIEKSVTQTLSNSVHDVLSQDDIQAHAKEFVNTILRDQTVQVQSGKAIRKTMQYAVTPGWLDWIWSRDPQIVSDLVQSSSNLSDAPSSTIPSDIAQQEFAAKTLNTTPESRQNPNE